MVNQRNRPVSCGIAVVTGLMILLCVFSGIAVAAGGVNYVNYSNVTASTGSTYLGFSTDFDANFSSVSTDSLNESGSQVYMVGKTGFSLSKPSQSGMKLTFTVPETAVNRTGTRGAFVFPKSSGYGTENGIRIAPDGEFGVLDRVALSYQEEEQTVSATFSLPPRTAFTPKLMYENPVGSVGVSFPSVAGMASGEASNMVSNTTIYGYAGNATGYGDSSLITSGTYLMDVIAAHVLNTTAAPVYLSVANSSLENLTGEDKNRITLNDVRGATVRSASAFQLNGTITGINVTGWDGEPVLVSLDEVSRDNVSMQFDVSIEDVEHPRTVNLTADTLATETVVVDASVAPVVWNVTVDPSEVAAAEGTEEVTLTAKLGELGYTEVEYIESTGIQWIDTGYTLSSSSKVEVKYRILNAHTGKDIPNSVFGSRTSFSSNDAFSYFSNSKDSLVYPQFGSDQGSVAVGQSTDVDYTYVGSKDGFYLNGELIKDASSEVFTTPHSAGLFAKWQENGGFTDRPFAGRIYYCRFWDDGELVREFIPVKRNADGVVGMYDLVTNTFFTNAGSGEFTAGPEVTVMTSQFGYGTVTYDWYVRNETTGNAWLFVGTTDTNSTKVMVSKDISTEFCVNASNVAGFDNTSETPVRFSVVREPVVEEFTVTPTTAQAKSGSGTRVVTVEAEPLLTVPEGYTEVEYVESTGTQWIDTGYMLSSSSKVEVKYRILNVHTGKDIPNSVFGSRTSSSSNDAFSYFSDSKYSLVYPQFGSDQGNVAVDQSTDVDYTYVGSKDGFYLNGELIKDASSEVFTTPHSAGLFAKWQENGGFTDRPFAGRIYYCRFWDDGELVREFIPVKRNADGVVGMYDLVTNTFFTNAGTGEFTAGPEVSYGGDYGTVNYEWFACNASTGNTWKSIGNTSLNILQYTVSTTENTEFYVNASNIAGNNESTKNNPGLFAIYTTLSLDTVGGDNESQVVNATLGSSVLDKTVNASVKTGYTFRGWDAIASPKNVTVINETGVLVKGVDGYTDAYGNWTNKTGAITLYANWSSVYHIRYHANNGSAVYVTVTDIPYNKDVTLNSSTELGFSPQDGLVFLNWTPYANGTGTSYAEQAVVRNLADLDQTADLYAVWQTNQTVRNSSVAGVTIGGTVYPKWNASPSNPYVAGYDNLNGTGEFGPFVIESPGAGTKLNYTLTKENLTESDHLGRIVVTYIDGGTVKTLVNTTDYTFEDHDGKGYISLNESGRTKSNLSKVSVVVKEYPLGDANINDLVDIVDSATVGVYVLKGGGESESPAALVFLPDENKVHGDVNHDGVVDVADLLAINKYLVGTEDLV